MKLVVVSDNHGLTKILEDIKLRHPNCILIHCGDSELPQEYLSGYNCVLGNNDYLLDFNYEKIISVDGVRILILHGHTVSMFNREQNLAIKARERECKLVCFGHTHVFQHSIVEDIVIVNPGSLNYNRDYSPACYAIVEVENGKVLSVEKAYVDLDEF